jgi:hypothetical protein
MLLDLLSKTAHSGLIVLAREGVENNLKLLKPRLVTSDRENGQIVVLKNCIIVRIQHLDHRMHLVT